MGGFKDHFSGHANEYSRFRPAWPLPLFAWLADQSSGQKLAWDCATGNGQAAIALAHYFRRVVATDASSEQIRHAVAHKQVDYRVETAENSSLGDLSVDLLVVAQAYHWLDQKSFLQEVRRVMRPGGLLAVVSYQLVSVNPDVDQVLHRLWGEILNGWWPTERALVDRGLDELILPWDEVEAPVFEMTLRWDLTILLNYLSTWSSVRRYRQSTKTDPLKEVIGELEQAWGRAGVERKVSWPISLRVCRRPV